MKSGLKISFLALEVPEPRVRKRPYKKVKVTVLTTREPAVTENDLDQGMQCILSIFIKYNQPKSFKFNAVVKNDIFSGMCEYMQKRRFCCKFQNMRSKKVSGNFWVSKKATIPCHSGQGHVI